MRGAHHCHDGSLGLYQLGNRRCRTIRRPFHVFLYIKLVFRLELLDHVSCIANAVGAAGVPMCLELTAQHCIGHFRSRRLANAAGNGQCARCKSGTHFLD